jgi:DNA-binding CsgD family transcriptional regulator
MPRSGDVIGRDAELASIAERLATISGGCTGLLLVGEAGIGKSTVWSAALEAAVSRSVSVLACRCAQTEAALSFSALGDLLRPVLDDPAVVLPAPQAQALEIALLRTDPVGAALDTRAVCLGFLSAVRQLSGSASVLLAIDDIQWLDAATAQVLEFALRRLASEPVVFLASLRSPQQGDLPMDLDDAMLAGGLTRLPVGPLASGAIAKILRDQAGASMSRPLVWRIFQASGGNPFYALELARELQAHGAAPAAGEPLPVPAGLARLVEARLEGLPAATRELLLLAAAAPHPTVALLAEACPGQQVVHSLQPALDRKIAEISGGGSIRFAHPLWASAAYSAAAAGARQQAHLRLAAVTPDAEARARHYALAAERPSEDVAAALSLAASTARARGAAQAAAECAALAARLTPGGEQQLRRRIEAADYLFRAGDATGACRQLEALVAELPPGPVRAQARLGVGRIRMYDAGNQAAISVLAPALEDAREEPLLRAEIHQMMAWICDFDLSEARRHADAAIALLESADAPGQLAGALGAKLWFDFLLGDGLKLDLARRAAALERQARATRAVEGVELPLGALLKSADRLDEARDKLEGVLAAAVREQDESSKFEVVLELGHLECLAGRWPLAERYVSEAAEFVELTGQEELRPAVLGLGGLLDALLGRLDSARAKAAEGLRLAEASRSTWFALMTLPVLGFAELSAGQPAPAAAYLARADEVCERIGLREPGRFRLHADYVEALIECGELDRAAVVLGRFAERGHAIGRPWAMATAARCSGLMLAAQGDLPAALAQIEIALHHHEQLPMPFELARTLLMGGQMHRRARHRRDARDMLAAADSLFTSLGAATWAARAREGLSRLGIRPAAPLELTATERRVADLAAAGLTNREIAERMFISLRTVEANLSRIYRKLGIRSRAELARDFGAGARGA